jgi:hypothetical protein
MNAVDDLEATCLIMETACTGLSRDACLAPGFVNLRELDRT